jgi:hypothetical protein
VGRFSLGIEGRSGTHVSRRGCEPGSRNFLRHGARNICDRSLRTRIKKSAGGGTRSGIFFAPSLKEFHDPGSRFCVLAKHRSAFRVPHGQRAGAVLPGAAFAVLMSVPGVGLEPTTSFEGKILSLLRKPFRHPGLFKFLPLAILFAHGATISSTPFRHPGVLNL